MVLRQNFFRVTFCLFLFTLTACASFRHTSEAPPTAPDETTPDKDQVLRKQLDDSRQTIAALSTKVDRLEGEVKSLGETVAQTPHLPKPTPVSSGVQTGLRVTSRMASNDPSAAFVEDEAVQHYRKAMILFESGNYPDSIVSFSSFLENYPDHPLAGSAQYYVGKSYLVQKAYKEAITEFQRELTSYDRSPHIADTLTDLASAEDSLNRPEDANRYRQLLTSLFPQSQAASAKQVDVAPVKPTTPPPGAADLDSPPAADAAAGDTETHVLPLDKAASANTPTAPTIEAPAKPQRPVIPGSTSGMDAPPSAGKLSPALTAEPEDKEPE